MKHHKAKVDFSIVEQARDMHDEQMSLKVISKKVEELVGNQVSNNTLIDWLYFRTRVNR